MNNFIKIMVIIQNCTHRVQFYLEVIIVKLWLLKAMKKEMVENGELDKDGGNRNMVYLLVNKK